METMVRTSAEHLRSTETINILASAVSIGKLAIVRPSVVSSPVLSRAPRTQSWYIEFKMFSYRPILVSTVGMEPEKRDSPEEEDP